MASTSVDMIFRKQYIRCFVESLSVSKRPGVIEFENRDRLNWLVRSYLQKPNDNYKPIFGNDVVKIVVPLNWRETQKMMVLPKNCWKSLENEFEGLFFLLYQQFDTAGSLDHKKRKGIRIQFLEMCNITEDVMTEDSFRKAFDRFIEKISRKNRDFLNTKELTLLSYYKSVC